MKTFLSVILLMLCMVARAADDQAKQKNELPASALEILEGAETLILVSVDFRKEERDETKFFHGFQTLGEIEVKNAAERKELLAALRKGVEENQDTGAKCFVPRHGIRATFKGKSVDLVICFECMWVYVYESDQKRRILMTSDSPQPVFDKLLKAAKVPLAPKPGEEKK